MEKRVAKIWRSSPLSPLEPVDINPMQSILHYSGLPQFTSPAMSQVPNTAGWAGEFARNPRKLPGTAGNRTKVNWLGRLRVTAELPGPRMTRWVKNDTVQSTVSNKWKKKKRWKLFKDMWKREAKRLGNNKITENGIEHYDEMTAKLKENFEN